MVLQASSIFNPQFPTGFALMIQARTILVILGILLYMAVSETTGSIESYYNTICLSAIIQSVIAIPNYWHVYPYDSFLAWIGVPIDIPADMIVGTLENSGFFAIYLAICLPFFFRPRWRFFIPVVLFHLAMTHSSTAVFSATVGVIAYTGLSWKVIIPAIVAGGLFTWKDGIGPSIMVRFEFWAKCLRNYHLNPINIIFGHGIGSSWGENYNLHNDWLQLFWYTGLTGIGLAADYVLNIYRNDKYLFAAFVTACTSALGNYPFHLAPSMYLIILIAGLIERRRRENYGIS
jgi:hypothetical protein